MGKKMNIASLFFKVEKDETASEPAPVTQAAVAQVSMATAPTFAAKEDAEIKKQLASALEQANQAGYDYFEFAQAVDAQAAIIPAEAVRFQASFAAAATMGTTVDKLLGSAQFYLSILKGKEDEFNKTVEQHMAEAVTSREKELTQYDGDMQAKAEQIKKLTEEINALQQKKTSIINEVSASKSQIEQVRNNFSATMRVFVDKINADIGKIQQYLVK
jgi:DNA repair exonuclease SbcCD ATPase subunit